MSSSPRSVDRPPTALLRHCIQREPGITLRRLRDESGMRHDRLLRHLAIIQEAGEALCRRFRGRMHVLPRLEHAEAWWRQLLVLKRSGVLGMHAWIEANGPCQQCDIAAHMRITAGFHLNAVQARLRDLEAARLVDKIRRGEGSRWTWYTAKQPHPCVRDLLLEAEGPHR